MNQEMPHWLSKQAIISPNKLALETEKETLTFVELQKESERFARKLAFLGVKKNSRVAILSSNRKEMAIAAYALSYLKAVIVMLNIRLTNEELTYQLSLSEAELIIMTDELGKEKKLAHQHQKTYEEIQDCPEEKVDLATSIHLDDPYTMMFTSGTTGKPKAVIHTYGNHWWSAISSMLNLGLEKNDKWLLTLPMFHIGGFSILMKCIIYGMPIYIMNKYSVKKLLQTINDKQVTIASLVTLMLRQLLDELKEFDLPCHLRCILLGGGSVPEMLLKKVQQKQIPLFQSYGMTETSSQIVTLSLDDALVKLGSAGKPLFPAEIKIMNEGSDGVGEIWVKGPMVMKGYFNNEKANEAAFDHGWFKTGDLGYTDNEGFLYVVDRRSDLIISGGENIYPTEIENVILQFEGVKEAAVVGKEDEKWGEVPVAFVVLHEKKNVDIQAFLKEKLAGFKLPKEIYVVDSLPKNASNKIMRHQLKMQLHS